MILGGSDTTSMTLSWILSLVLNNSEVLSKAKNELDQLVGDERKVGDSDILNLVYLRAIVKESMRLFQGVPLSREVKEDCNIGGFSVKAGARVLVNVWKVQQDPSVWFAPSEFRLERFVTNNLGMDVRGQQFELLPFGLVDGCVQGSRSRFKSFIWHLHVSFIASIWQFQRMLKPTGP
ncbi:hypothetical protein IFM89_019693 [Coptis chinensis]|uniref:Cytochrome P450 n=1 Tax=Coptis chinensis TaxID=261450 RepID=A0A835GXD8_9MAGN|nr:hypothetical protein IFM89_019693 [Coptis chinensis]